MKDSEFANRIAYECLNQYQNLPKKGKPIQGKEWTLLSCIVTSLNGIFKVVSLATGTKCLGRSKMSSAGDLINDSHAEVLCRRCFLRYLYDQITEYKNTGSSEIIVNCNENNQYQINPEVKFHFFSSHVPCGDASIVPKLFHYGKRKSENNNFKAVKRAKMEVVVETTDAVQCSTRIGGVTGDEDMNEICCDSVGEEIPVDIHRTGAKCLAGEDPRLPGALYHTVGAVRTKPGRGDPTLSVSCSDKLARWIACGLQGALLSLLLTRPVLLDSVVIGGGGPYSQEVLERAIITRTGTPHRPTVLQSELVFPESAYRVSDSSKPCPSAIMWARVSHKPLEVCVEGRRQGATKKCRDNGRLMTCKLELLRTFLALTENRYCGMKYSDIKASAEQYNKAWFHTREILGTWTTKPGHLQHFTLT